MELPTTGQHCELTTCHRLDFLPVRCSGCKKIFCTEHYRFGEHACAAPRVLDFQVPVCPICEQPIGMRPTEDPNAVVSAHIENNCQTDTRKVYANRCSMNGCKQRTVVKITCEECGKSYCLAHRHAASHKCAGKDQHRSNFLSAHEKRNVGSVAEQPPSRRFDKAYSDLQGGLTEDEALAKAMQTSAQQQQQQQTSSASTSSRQATTSTGNGTRRDTSTCTIS